MNIWDFAMDSVTGILTTPCELAVRKYVPSIRASLAIVLVKDYGLSIYRTAKLLKLTPAAVSNYVLGRRGKEYVDIILKDKELYNLVSKLAEQIISGNISEKEVSKHLCEICMSLRTRVEKGFTKESCTQTH
ncbi:transcriptional regulator [Pyrofollis japonicus]|uniref:transcriptional regulator n=1 Tax=Pyrofollis japonicus TaxID=3060460 RepID=UPI00295AC458|nr:hypothetical protein [Pyrofollis japonicus]BEP17006.1 transcriptional regulator [Pyrofollis japonicus]